MKKIFIYRSIVALAVMIAVLVACTEDTAQVRLDPQLATSEILEITSEQASVTGFVIAEGEGLTERGVCYNTAADPTIDDNKVVFQDSVEGATYSVTITGLDFATTYYTRAYATGAEGTIYGEEMTFTTLPVVPTVTTADISDISYTSAMGGGEVTANGGAEVTAYGICYSTVSEPTVNDAKTTDGNGLEAFTSSLSGLDDNTMYYVRAYATNSAGTAYGDEVSFTTLQPLNRTWNVPGDYVAASYPGSDLADWSPDASPQIKSGLSAPDNLEGYVYMANVTNNWKLATEDNWDGTVYGDGGGGTLTDDPGGANMTSPEGYYFIQADAAALTYTALATTWAVIGDATPNGWTGDSPLTYNPEQQVWTGGFTFVEGPFKFRANGSWDDPDPNYGSDAADGTLQAGGGNIPVGTAGDYAITLDLSTPLDYTYRADRWGVIGDATGSWVDDTNMSWDEVNDVFTVTLDLVAGEMKFRANDDWAYDLGGDPDAFLTVGGANIVVDDAGNYTITLDPWNKVATITMN